MRDDDFRTLQGTQMLVWITTSLILCVEHRTFQLTDIVIQRSCSYQLRLGTYLLGHVRCQIGHLHRVLEGSWRLLRHLLEQWVVDVRQLNQRHITHESEGLLHHPQERIGEEQQEAVDAEIHIDSAIQVADVCSNREFVGSIKQIIGQRHHNGRLNNLRTLGQLTQTEYHHNACYRLEEDKLIRAVERQGNQQHHRHMGDECRS